MGAVGGLHSKASGSRGRPYAVMMLVAFGAALLGVMLLHKFRERRICNLLLKRTDQDLHSFQLLFQRERDRSKELEKNSEDMKATLYSLRTQKMELDRRLLELLSTIGSLRDEQKTINVALKEKKKEIKMLRNRELESGNENSRVVALTQSLRQKEAELEDLRRRFESRGGAATDDPAQQNEQLPESSGGKGGETNEATESRDGTQKDEETERMVVEGEERQKQESTEDEGEKKEAADGEVRKVEGEESKITKDQTEEEAKDSRALENHRADKILKSGMKMQRETGKYERTRKIKGKRWRYIAKKRTMDNGWRLISKKRKQEINRNVDESGVISMDHRKFFKGGASNEEKMLEYPKEAREDQTEKERQELNSRKGGILREDGERKQNDKQQSGDGEEGDGSIEQNPGEKMELKDLKSEENQEPDGRFSKESNSDVREEEENKEETEESEF